jgi:CheY-like chemotaxis protein/two-component sensor histidine kinase
MRTPLNGIMGLTDLALASGDSEKMRDYLVKIRKSGAVLCGLVDDTLIMSRMENDKYRLQPTPVNTAEMFSEVLEPIRALAEEKGVHLRENISARWPEYLLADRTSLQKILLNLLSNAVRYTPSGGIVTLDCRLDPQEKSHPDGVIVVSDTGAGVAADFLPHIFEPFAQENPDHADTSGSGMGLSIVKHIVDAMGGTIEVASEKGKGAVFTVRLPLEELKTPPAVPQDSGGAALLKGKHALICEDNALNLEIVKTLLERYGMEVVGAENGKLGVEAFEKSSAGWFDVVLLDLRMPVMDGFTAARAIRAMDRPDAKNVPILAVSADAYADDVQKCGDVGMNGHIAKPIDPGILYDTLVEKIGVTRGDCKK